MKKKKWIIIICLALIFGTTIFAVKKGQDLIAEKKLLEVEFPQEGDKAEENMFSLLYQGDFTYSSVDITFDPSKLRVSDEDWGYPSTICLEAKNDVASALKIYYEEFSVNELYERYMREGWDITDWPREGTVAGFPTYFFDAPGGTTFAILIGNGMCITSFYSGEMDLEELLSYAFLEIKEGDGTTIRPHVPYIIKDNGKKLFILFENGENWILAYDEDEVKSLYTGKFFNLDLHDCYLLPSELPYIYITDKYSSIEEFDRGEGQLDEGWETGLPVNKIKVKDVMIEYIDNKKDKAIFFIPLKEGYALRGVYRYRPNKITGEIPFTIEEIFSKIFGGRVKEVQSKQ